MAADLVIEEVVDEVDEEMAKDTVEGEEGVEAVGIVVEEGTVEEEEGEEEGGEILGASEVVGAMGGTVGQGEGRDGAGEGQLISSGIFPTPSVFKSPF